jgi:Rod binding domain-containing protein
MKISPEQIRLHATMPPEQKLKQGMGESLEAKKYRLRKATKEFESFFILNMLKAMRKTIPQSEILKGGLGQDVYTSMFDEELARNVAGGSPNSLADILYKSLERHLEATESAKLEKTGAEKEIIPTSIQETRRDAATIKSMPEPQRGPINDKDDFAAETSAANIATSSAKPKIAADPVLKEYGPTIDKASQEFNVDPRLIYSVIIAESGGKADAVSSRGAKGLMQLIDSTAAEMGIADSLDPHQNIVGGTKYLRQLLDRFDGSLKLALAAYNAGPGTVSKYNGVPPYSETERYIENVLGRLHSVKKP